jgi:hypothetical protein
MGGAQCPAPSSRRAQPSCACASYRASWGGGCAGAGGWGSVGGRGLVGGPYYERNSAVAGLGDAAKGAASSTNMELDLTGDLARQSLAARTQG